MKTMGKAILKGKEVIEIEDLESWAKDFENSDRQLARDNIGGVLVSTVFLGIDHNLGGEKPMWFETMIFRGKYDQYLERYETYDQAILGHAKAVEKVKETSLLYKVCYWAFKIYRLPLYLFARKEWDRIYNDYL